jgi:hypothetical protein
VWRYVNDAEAAVVRKIFEFAAAGFGKKGIAKTLNEERALCPRSQQGRPASWSPSSVFEVLARPLYRGEIAWGRPIGRKPKYLLSEFGKCSARGGSLYVRSRDHGAHRAFFYGCSSYHLRGRTVCGNCAEMGMETADRAVLATLRDDLLQPAVVRGAIARAIEYLQPSTDSGERERLQGDAEGLDRELARLTGAIAAGGELPALLSAIQERELLGDLEDWRGLLADDDAAARPLLQRLLGGRLVFRLLEPGIHAPCEFRGMASIGGLLIGVVGVQNEWRPQRGRYPLPCMVPRSGRGARRARLRLRC